jgi:hypothetical protein
MTGQPMPYRWRALVYSRQNRQNTWIGYTARQLRQMDRMARRESYRERGDLPWTPPPTRRGYP